MTQPLFPQMAHALFAGLAPDIAVKEIGAGRLPSCFAVDDLAIGSIKLAALEIAAATGASSVTLDKRLSQLWFDMTLRPNGWRIPSAWDDLAGVYQTCDGWIRLHTNAPHHRAAALNLLKCPPTKSAVSSAVKTWEKDTLEQAIVTARGAAASMRSMSDWRAHPQGQAVAQEPLISWQSSEIDAPKIDLKGLRILDLTRVLAGPVATRCLAGFGAEVLRIDPPDWEEPGLVPDISIGKRRAALDLKAAKDRSVFEHLLRRADMLIHGYRPDALVRLGYGPEERLALNPYLMDISLNAYGWTGPWANRRGFDSLVQMSCGIAHEGMQRAGGNRPNPLPVQALDHATGYIIAAAAAHAIRLRRDRGKIMSAQVSLARVGHLLTSGGSHHEMAGDIIAEDRYYLPEATVWGPAHRIKFPFEIDASGPNYPYQAGPLRMDPAVWA